MEATPANRGERLASAKRVTLAIAGPLALVLGGAASERAIMPAAPRTFLGPVSDAQALAANPAIAALAASPAAPDPATALTVRTINAMTPFARGGLTSAPPFFLGGRLTDRLRAVDCLAAAAYYEAGMGAADQRAVAQVVLNRVRHPAFPHTVCGVVFQGSARATGCQFTFTCDGSMARRRPSPLAWHEAEAMAEEMISGRVEPAVGLATHYHTDWVLPAWSGEMDKLAAVRSHLFFRWRGVQGGLASFVSAYGGGEPRIALLGGLSPAHRLESSGASPFPDDAATATAPALVALHQTGSSFGPGRERLPDRAGAPDEGDFFVTLAATADPDSFPQLAERSCAGRSRCRFIGWTNPARSVSHLPMPGSSVDAISFMLVRREGVRSGRAQWNCAEFPRLEQDQCLRRGG